MPASTVTEVVCSPVPLGADAALDHAVSRAMLSRVARGEIGGAIRIWGPVPALALSRLDLLRPGAQAAITQAKAAGLAPIRRMSGGHAVVLGARSLCAGIAQPAASFEGTQERYEHLIEAVVDALRALGVDAEQGTLPGEWCPGAWSIRSGRAKIAGLAQRAVKGAAWAEAVIELAPVPAERELLASVYAALDLELDPATFGSVQEAGASADAGFAALADELLERLSPGGEPRSAPATATLEAARGFAPGFALEAL